MPLVIRAQAAAWVPRREKSAHKGSQGRVYILAGSRGMMGAGAISTLGALRAGAGLVKWGTVLSLSEVAAKRAPLEATIDDFADAGGHLTLKNLTEIKTRARGYESDVIAVGPGMGQATGTAELIRALVRTIHIPLVLDADGLNAFQKRPAELSQHSGPLIITPHQGELARLLKVSNAIIGKNREASALKAAKEFRCICLLKGPGTIITDGRQVWKNPTGNPGMASGGMGDLLTGVIAGLWAQRLKKAHPDPLAAAALGAYVHGLAGDLAQKDLKTASMLATDVAIYIARALKKLGGHS